MKVRMLSQPEVMHACNNILKEARKHKAKYLQSNKSKKWYYRRAGFYI